MGDFPGGSDGKASACSAYILGQTLTPASKTQLFGKAVAYGDEWLGNESVGKREDEFQRISPLEIRWSQL